MAYLLLMSTDADIAGTTLPTTWGDPDGRYDWDRIAAGDLNLPNGCVIIVSAHGNASEIGNHASGAIDIDPQRFVALIRANMAAGASPSRIFLSVCSDGLPQYGAAVRKAMDREATLKGTSLYAHWDSVDIPVEGMYSDEWTKIS